MSHAARSARGYMVGSHPYGVLVLLAGAMRARTRWTLPFAQKVVMLPTRA